MDKILYINTVSDIRIKEMANSNEEFDASPSNIQKIILHYNPDVDSSNKIKEIDSPTSVDYTQTYVEAMDLGSISFVFPNKTINIPQTLLDMNDTIFIYTQKYNDKYLRYFVTKNIENVSDYTWYVYLLLGYIEVDEIVDDPNSLDLSTARLVTRLHVDTTVM